MGKVICVQQAVALIDYAAKCKGYTPGQMSTFTEMGLSTWFRRKRYPNEFRVKELQELSKKLDIDFVIHNGEMQAKIV